MEKEGRNPTFADGERNQWASKDDLKPLPVKLKYAYLEEHGQCPVVISSLLSTLPENILLDILKENKQAIGWKIIDLRGISPEICTHHIYLEEKAKSVR